MEIKDYAALLNTKAEFRNPNLFLYGPPGVGKTVTGACFPNPLFVRDKQEDGINTLKTSNLVDPNIPVMPVAETWMELLQQMAWIASKSEGFQTLVVDTIGGLERLCAEHICKTQFRGQWGEKGFGGFGRGWEACVPEWRRLINAFDSIRDKKGMQIVLLAHSQVKMFKNPEGDDYDRYQPELHHKIWAATSKWVDMILFANFFVEVEESGLRKKGRGGTLRYMYPVGTAAYEAKNRHGLTDDIAMGDSGKDAYSNLVAAIEAAKKGNSYG